MVAPLSPDRDRLAAIREALPAVGAGIYLNTAVAGPLPAETARAMAEEAAREATLGRAHPADAAETLERVGEARAAMAAVLAVDLDELALTRGRVDGLRMALGAIPSRAGDRAVLLTDGRGADGWPIAWMRTAGLDVVELPIEDMPPAEILRTVEGALQSTTRFVGLPHVAASTGARLPVGSIAALAHDAQAVVALDGSNAIGAVPVAPLDLGVDVIAFSSERWLLGPAGLGGLWCGPGMLDTLRSVHGHAFADPSDATASAEGWHRPSVVGFARSCGLLAMQIGLPWAWDRVAQLTAQVDGALRALDGVEVLSPSEPAERAAIVTFRIPGWGARVALDELGARVFALAGVIEPLEAIRISLGAWNSEDEIDRFVAGVGLLAAHTPETLPPRRTLNILE